MTKPTMVEPARRAAWDAYLVITVDLLPALGRLPVDTRQMTATLTGLALRIRTWASVWGTTGNMLGAAINTAQRLHRNGHHTHLDSLLRVIARRLFRISSRRPNPAPGRTAER